MIFELLVVFFLPSYPQLNAVKVKELCELLSYWNGSSFLCRNQVHSYHLYASKSLALEIFLEIYFVNYVAHTRNLSN